MPDFRTSVQKIAEGAARGDERDGPETEYRVKIRAGIPLADAGKSTTVRVTGRATKRELTAQLESEGYRVERIERRKPGSWLFW